MLCITSPEKDFTEYEAELIINYINNGGNIMWLNDPSFSDDQFPNMQKILDQFGVKFEKGVIFEQDPNKMAIQNPNLIVPNISYTDITNDIATDGGIIIPNSGRIKLMDSDKMEELGINVEPLLTSSDKSFFRTDLSIVSNTKTSTETEESSTIGALINKKINDEKTSKMIVFANNLFVVDLELKIGNQNISAINLLNNKDLALNSVAYLTDRQDAIKIRKDIGTVTYTATEAQDMIIRIIIFAMPIVIIISGIIVWQIRRRKR